jgi:hypothetical protein
MADVALFVGFGHQARGRETQASKVFGEAMAYWAELQAKGEIESFEVAVLEAHGGDLSGFMLLRGDQERLARLHGSPEFQRLMLRAEAIADRVGVVYARLDAAAAEWVARSNEAAADLTS